MNVLSRSVEYSPLGILKALSYNAVLLKKGKITASQWIDSFAGGLSGSLIFVLGMLLHSLGIIKGGFDDDDEDGFAKLTGQQAYSIEILGHSYTIDWMAPVCIPFLMGASLQDSLESEGNGNLISNIESSFYKFTGPLLELSMLSGVQNLLYSVKYASKPEQIPTALLNSALSYFNQALPAIGGKIANTIDGTQRSNYTDKTSAIPEILQTTINQIKAKIPGLSMTRPEYIDAWGETKDRGGFIQRFFQNFISPGYYSKVEADMISDELNRLYKSTGDNAVFPDNAPKYFKIGDYKKNLTADEYVEYATIKGQKSAQYIALAISNEEYAKLSDEYKAEVIADIYSYCNAFAKSSLVYSYDEFIKMDIVDICESRYNSFTDESKKRLVKEFFLEKYTKPFVAERNGKSISDFYIEKYAKEQTDKLKQQDKSTENKPNVDNIIKKW